MDLEEWGQLVRTLNQDIGKMLRAQRRSDEIHGAIQLRATNPTEEQFIDEDLNKQPIGTPMTFTVAGTQIKVWKLHRWGLESRDVKGADLFYEITNTKFTLIQYKMPNRHDRVILNSTQLSELQAACPVECLPSDRFSCGAWYALRSGRNSAYFPACEAKQIFDRFKSRRTGAFIKGLSQRQFEQDFGLCRIGARTRPVGINEYRDVRVQEDRVFVRVSQNT